MADRDGVSIPLGALARYLKFLRLLLKDLLLGCRKPAVELQSEPQAGP